MPVEDAVKFIISCGVIHPEDETVTHDGFSPPPEAYPQQEDSDDDDR